MLKLPMRPLFSAASNCGSTSAAVRSASGCVPGIGVTPGSIEIRIALVASLSSSRRSTGKNVLFDAAIAALKYSSLPALKTSGSLNRMSNTIAAGFCAWICSTNSPSTCRGHGQRP